MPAGKVDNDFAAIKSDNRLNMCWQAINGSKSEYGEHG